MKAGWGDWAKPGEGQMVSKKILNARDKLLAQVNAENSKKAANRKDSMAKMMNVVISERRIKTASKFMVADIPHPFTTREEYERSLQMPVGGECNLDDVQWIDRFNVLSICVVVINAWFSPYQFLHSCSFIWLSTTATHGVTLLSYDRVFFLCIIDAFFVSLVSTPHRRMECIKCG